MTSSKSVDPANAPPWERKKPAGKSKPLTKAQVAAARARAAKAGRTYPNLVDNMWAARNASPSRIGKSTAKK